MNHTASSALALARPALTGLIILNFIYALCLVALLVYSLTLPETTWKALGFDVEGNQKMIAPALRTIIVIGLLGAAIAYVVLVRLRAIVDSVRVGDPFIVENARRLQAIAWSVLAGEGLRLVVVAIAAAVTTPSHPVNLGVRFSFAPWLAVLMLFVLAGVFAHGARMREDLAGTV